MALATVGSERTSPWDVASPRVERAAMLHTWDRVGFLHWRTSTPDLQRLLPEGLRVDTFDGSAWVGIVAFDLTLTAPGVPPLPWASRTPEINVRTYVTGPDGRPGIVFLSLDAARLGLVAGARVLYRLPYRWSRLRFSRAGDVVTYTCRRRTLRADAPEGEIALELRGACSRLDDLDHFLTSRWTFYCRLRRGLCCTSVEHDPWVLRRARALYARQTLVDELGLPSVTGDPVVHYSEHLDVRMGWPHLAAAGIDHEGGS